MYCCPMYCCPVFMFSIRYIWTLGLSTLASGSPRKRAVSGCDSGSAQQRSTDSAAKLRHQAKQLRVLRKFTLHGRESRTKQSQTALLCGFVPNLKAQRLVTAKLPSKMKDNRKEPVGHTGEAYPQTRRARQAFQQSLTRTQSLATA